MFASSPPLSQTLRELWQTFLMRDFQTVLEDATCSQEKNKKKKEKRETFWLWVVESFELFSLKTRWAYAHTEKHKLPVDQTSEAWEGHGCPWACCPVEGCSFPARCVCAAGAGTSKLQGWQPSLRSQPLAVGDWGYNEEMNGFCWLFEWNWLHRLHWEQGGHGIPPRGRRREEWGWNKLGRLCQLLSQWHHPLSSALRAGWHREGCLLSESLSVSKEMNGVLSVSFHTGLDLMPSRLKPTCCWHASLRI